MHERRVDYLREEIHHTNDVEVTFSFSRSNKIVHSFSYKHKLIKQITTLLDKCHRDCEDI